MQRSKLFTAVFAFLLSASFLPAMANAQSYPPPPPPRRPAAFVLGTAHVDGPTDHDNIKVGRYAGRFHAIMLRVRYAPIQFDHVVIHYGNGTAETLPVRAFIGPGQGSQWIRLPGRRRVIHSLELWYARAQPNNPTRPEVVLWGAP